MFYLFFVSELTGSEWSGAIRGGIRVREGKWGGGNGKKGWGGEWREQWLWMGVSGGFVWGEVVVVMGGWWLVDGMSEKEGEEEEEKGKK